MPGPQKSTPNDHAIAVFFIRGKYLCLLEYTILATVSFQLSMIYHKILATQYVAPFFIRKIE